ncbi:hypothetical protein LHP98_17640 [Rhodobacter sp. Har01]|uniref:hypothetical protein n=1 Tax=Rhodobacter sp. Har01 TaxID=2883999 RepID=UPI001D074DEC|nr:hypothetical protein [Rhodobacter sp. Har01]MCB6179946.1 hypothetical protein [Rhodobacter sp. Har01]
MSEHRSFSSGAIGGGADRGTVEPHIPKLEKGNGLPGFLEPWLMVAKALKPRSQATVRSPKGGSVSIGVLIGSARRGSTDRAALVGL